MGLYQTSPLVAARHRAEDAARGLGWLEVVVMNEYIISAIRNTPLDLPFMPPSYRLYAEAHRTTLLLRVLLDNLSPVNQGELNTRVHRLWERSHARTMRRWYAYAPHTAKEGN